MSEYVFQTNFNGTYKAKTPRGCFEMFIPNDMKAVLDRITEYKKGHFAIQGHNPGMTIEAKELFYRDLSK